MKITYDGNLAIFVSPYIDQKGLFALMEKASKSTDGTATGVLNVVVTGKTVVATGYYDSRTDELTVTAEV